MVMIYNGQRFWHTVGYYILKCVHAHLIVNVHYLLDSNVQRNKYDNLKITWNIFLSFFMASLSSIATSCALHLNELVVFLTI